MPDGRCPTLTYFCIAASLALATTPASAQSIRADSLPPMSWIERYLPEDLPALKYPEYAEGLDKAQMQIRAGRYKLALQSLQRAPAPQSAPWLMLKAQALLSSGNNQEALRVLAAAELKDNPRAQRMAAEAMAASGSRQEAIALLISAIRTFPDNAQLRLELAITLESVGQLTKARDALKWFSEQKFVERWRTLQALYRQLVATGADLHLGLVQSASVLGIFQGR